MPTRAQLEEMLKSDPEDTFLLYAHAKACVGEGDLETGLRQFDAVIEHDPDHVASYFQKGQVLAENGNTDEAREIIQRGIAVARKVGDDHAEQEMREFLQSIV